MKKLKKILILLMILCLILGMWLANRNRLEEYTKTEFIMDTTCSVTFYGEESALAGKAVFDEVKRIDALMNMYNENSEVSLINKAKSGEKIKVSDDTYYVIKTALEICEDSGGAFDITVAPLMELWDFNGDDEKIPTQESIDKALKNVGYKNIVLESGNMIYKLKSETEIDLGAAAKGYAGDKAIEIAKKYKLKGGIIDLGGNILCFGENPNSENGKWTVGIQTPFAPTGTYEKTVEISDKAVVTSGTYQRYFEKSGKIYHHILNPETGYPQMKEYNSVTVVSDSSLKADCLTTAIFVMGENKDIARKYNVEVYFE